ncbi:protein kinase domain-containing protein [Sandaracinus amylolyticus]|uniref:protein kinase domain-containing protein n=1 Tax=Sandaracinus amylolyticus TaxID=927083 RepID=UPI001F21A2D8|nr:protein kinase [Sandaracinus amylolyticus]
MRSVLEDNPWGGIPGTRADRVGPVSADVPSPRAEAMESFAKVCPRCGMRFDAAASFCQKDGAALRLAEEDTDPLIGQVLLDQFRLEERIGVGGMGTVYRARQASLGRDVAIKILHPDLARNPDAVRRFQREARISTALDHPNVVRVFLFGQLPDGSLYLVMELLRGRTLAELVRVESPLPVHRALHIATQVCDGVGEAHGQGIVHRDVKPENVFLVTKGRDPDFVKVLDFGIARVLRGDDATAATQSGLVFGTARYISPEGAAGERTDARSDVYSLGVMTYQLLSGETPFDAGSPVTLLMKHIHDAPPHLKSKPGGKHVPDAVADVVMRALTKNPEGRYDDAMELAEVLRMAAQRAGLDVVRMRSGASSVSSLVGERRDPSGPMIRERAPIAVPSQSTLDGAPDPFGTTGGTKAMPIPGLRAGRPSSGARGTITTVAIAFFVGALAVGGGAWAVRALTAPDPIVLEAEELVRRADAALAAGRFDAQSSADAGEEHVRALTDRLLAVRPGDPDATRLRRAAADRLMAEAGQAERDERLEDALDRARRALALLGTDAAASEVIARLESVLAQPAREAALVVTPETPFAGDPVLLSAQLARGQRIDEEDRPRFVVRRGTQRLGASIDATPGRDTNTWIAPYTFATTGSYRVKFVAGDDDDEDRVELTAEVDVVRSPRAPTSRQSDPPPVTTQGAYTPLHAPQVIDAPAPPRTQQLAAAQPPQVIAPPTPPVASPPPIFPLAPSPPPPQQVEPPPPPPPPTPWTSGGQ